MLLIAIATAYLALCLCLTAIMPETIQRRLRSGKVETKYWLVPALPLLLAIRLRRSTTRSELRGARKTGQKRRARTKSGRVYNYFSNGYEPRRPRRGAMPRSLRRRSGGKGDQLSA